MLIEFKTIIHKTICYVVFGTCPHDEGYNKLNPGHDIKLHLIVQLLFWNAGKVQSISLLLLFRGPLKPAVAPEMVKLTSLK